MKKKIDSFSNLKGIVLRYFQFVMGVFLLAVSFNLFLLPNDFVVGGVSGLSIIFQELFGFDTAVFIFIGSLILLIISYFALGKDKTAASVAGSILFPLLVKLTSSISTWISLDQSQTLVMAIFGGILFGFGSGLCLKNGFTTGGTDIVNQIISKYGHMSIGNAMLLCEGTIVISSCLVFGVTKVMYALVILYISSLLTDKVILGISDSKAFYIITDYEEEAMKYVLTELNHGATIFEAKGGYGNSKKKVIFCVVPTKEYFKLKEGIAAIDKEAFFVVTDAYEVYGGE